MINFRSGLPVHRYMENAVNIQNDACAHVSVEAESRLKFTTAKCCNLKSKEIKQKMITWSIGYFFLASMLTNNTSITVQ